MSKDRESKTVLVSGVASYKDESKTSTTCFCTDFEGPINKEALNIIRDCFLESEYAKNIGMKYFVITNWKRLEEAVDENEYL